MKHAPPPLRGKTRHKEIAGGWALESVLHADTLSGARVKLRHRCFLDTCAEMASRPHSSVRLGRILEANSVMSMITSRTTYAGGSEMSDACIMVSSDVDH